MRVHFIAIGGAVMHNLAIALVNKGYAVTGSDDEIFEPALSNLRNYGILPDKFGWYPEKITSDLDAVILGMHAKAGNPELDKAVELGLKIYSFPEYIFQQSINKTRIVIAGSHGKTTITSMIMHVLKSQGIDFDYLVGAKIEGFDIMVRLSDAPFIVIEGDEYLTSALDRRPKFLHYKPKIALISGIAWDHINVFPTFEEYKEQFQFFIQSIENDGYLIFCDDDKTLSEVVKSSNWGGKVIPYNLLDFETKDGKTRIILKGDPPKYYPINFFGKHNLLNLSGAKEICKLLGINESDFYQSIISFKGAANRLQLVAENEHTTIFKDFAHAPSKLKATVEAVNLQFQHRKLIAVMELHTYSSLSKNFLAHYRGSMDQADIPVIFFDPAAIALKKLPPITIEDVFEGFGNKKLKIFTNPLQLQEFILQQNYVNCNLLLMSSGNFGGLEIMKLAEKIVTIGK
ncbi:MAG TPA: Mur ligase family protein [Bacteroidales bacterium]|jgi:UDP-N-acetylmuramate: L-alanyl-gamma-D-glutamyl-meso-diaminopimelate ligase|nr:peptidoglycan synthetase [Bacteroidales bacterium]MBP7874130.1 peptidoglycan synthetase [Bacteroidales bacterium]NLH33404.1 peptidoglycan synthetase [Lentimicrobium sp.]HQB48166.1 Mur ligase family protein [Bacteroidales bacterium]